MKTFSINPIKFSNLHSIKSNKSVSSAPKASYNTYFNNRLSETLGRAQVSFQARKASKEYFQNTESGYSYQRSQAGFSDGFIYDKIMGSFSFNSEIPGGKKLVNYNRQTNTETTTIEREEGTYEYIVKPGFNQQRFIDKQGRTISAQSLNTVTAELRTYFFDTELNREIRTRRSHGAQETVVTDLSTGKEVNRGRLTWVDEISEDGKTRITRNIVKDIVVKEESLDRKFPYTIEYYDDNNNRKKLETYINRRNGTFITKRYFNAPGEIISSKTITSKNGNCREVITYDKFGNETKHILNQQSGINTGSSLIYIPGTKIIDYEIKSSQDDRTKVTTYTKIQYKETPNVAEAANTFNENDELIETTVYREDGTMPKIIIRYYDDGTREETDYFLNGSTKQSRKYHANGSLSSVSEYVKSEGLRNKSRKYKTTTIDPKTQNVYSCIYDSSGKRIESYVIEDKDGYRLEDGTYYKDSSNIHFLRQYNKGLCTEQEFENNKSGILISCKSYLSSVCRPDSEEEKELEANGFSVFHGAEIDESEAAKSMESKDVIKRIFDVLYNNGDFFAIKDDEWEVVLEAFQLKDMRQLDSIFENKRQFNKISNILRQRATKENFMETKMLEKILTYFYEN